MLWIGVLLISIGATVLKQSRFTFTKVAVSAAFSLMLIITLVNPDGLITRVNVNSSDPLDIAYLNELSIDRGPALATLDAATCQMARVGFLEDSHAREGDDLRS